MLELPLVQPVLWKRHYRHNCNVSGDASRELNSGGWVAWTYRSAKRSSSKFSWSAMASIGLVAMISCYINVTNANKRPWSMCKPRAVVNSRVEDVGGMGEKKGEIQSRSVARAGD